MAESKIDEGRYNPFYIIDGLPKFTGDDTTYSSAKWTQDLEDNAEIFGWSQQQKLIIARRCLSGTAELWLKTEKTFKTYDELKTALTKEFPETINSKQMHEIMSRRKKQSNESYYQYMLVMKELGKRAKFPDYVAIQYIIDGISDYEPNKLILYGVTTYSAFKEKLFQYETFKNKSKRADPPKRLPTLKIKETDNRDYREASFRDVRCFKCGDKGHLSNSCSKGVKCFKCNEFGHIGRNCEKPFILKESTNSNANHRGRSAMFVKHSKEAEACEINSSEVSNNLKMRASEGLNYRQCGPITSLSVDDDSNGGTKDINDVVLSVSEVNFKFNKSVKQVKMNDCVVEALIDTGSDLNLITYELFCKLNCIYKPERMLLTGLGSCKVYSIGKFDIEIIVDGHSYIIALHVVNSNVIPYHVILGQPFLYNTITIIEGGKVEVRPQCYDSSYLRCINCIDYSKESNQLLQAIIDDYKPLKTKEAPIKLKIVLRDDIPVSQRPRRLALTEEHVVKLQVDEWLSKGIIRPSNSEYASPLVLVKKKDGTTRVCVDYRKINQKMVKDEYPLPIIEDHIDKLCKAQVFSTIDLKNGFFHLPIDEGSIKYTAFVTSNPEGQYEFLRAPFGLSICPKYFTRYINIIFSDFIRNGVILIFVDDIIILAKDENEAICRLQEVLRVAAEYGLEINWKKCQLLQRSVEYLGYNVSNGTVKPSVEKTKAVMNFPVPRSLKQVHSFIGLTSYFRKFIENYALIAKPLTDLIRSGEFCFEEIHRKAFQTLKSKLCSEPVLRIFDIQLQTELHTDASKHGYAAILLQKDSQDGLLHPVYYLSRKTTEVQQKYSSYELEALAVIEAVKKFRRYLIGINFKIVTDCEAFQKTLNKKDVSAKVARWILFLQDFDYVIEHRTGDKMKHVDTLSRYFCFVDLELHARVKKAQEEDDQLKAIKEILSEKTYDDYLLENGVIYRGLLKKLVIPQVMDMEIIKRAHGIGHFGRKKIKDIIEKDYYISNLDSKIDKVVSTCVPCILSSRKLGKREGFLHPLDKGEVPLDTLHCDHLGPLDATKKMYNYILTVIDGYTKFVWIYPVKTLTSKETIEKLKLHQKDFGNPRRIVTDRGTAFTSGEFKLYCQDEGIEHVTITAGIPRGNGQVERMNSIIISTLTKMCLEEPGHWYKFVSKLQRVLNSTYQRSINTTPFELLTGVRLKLKEDMEILEYLDDENRLQFMKQRDEARQAAKAHILKIQEENRKTYNRKRKEGDVYKEGDLVAVQRTQFGNALKLKQKFYGPYKITKVLGNNRYEVEKIDRGKEGPIRTTSGVDYMKRWL